MMMILYFDSVIFNSELTCYIPEWHLLYISLLYSPINGVYKRRRTNL